MIKHETKDTKYNGKQEETKDLEWLAADRVNGENSSPVPRERTGSSQDYRTDSVIPQLMIYVVTATVANSMKYNALIETKTIECQVLLIC